MGDAEGGGGEGGRELFASQLESQEFLTRTQ